MLTRYTQVFKAVAIILGFFILTMLFPFAVAIHYDEPSADAFMHAFIIAICCALIIWFLTREAKREISVRDGFLLVALTWIILPLFASLPLLFFIEELSFTDAYFEAVSGLTATGATVLTDLDHMPISINLWRTQLHWLGGMGIIVLAVAVLPMLGIGGRQVFRVEVTGPMKETRLTPRITETAKGLWVVYVLMTIACVATLFFFGMGFWDALMHAFSVMGLGGFSSKDASLGHFQSLNLDLTVMFFAFVAGINFSTHFLALRGKTWKPYKSDAELPIYFGGLLLSSVGIAAYLVYFSGSYTNYWQALHHVSFHAISLATSLGFAIYDYSVWPLFAQLWILSLGTWLACAGSTGGGLKTMRAIILAKMALREMWLAIHPSAVKPVTVRRMPIPDNMLHGVLAFGFFYSSSLAILTFVQMASGLDPVTAFSSILATINNTGPGLGLVGPAQNYQVLNDFQVWVCTFTMILGRLEILTLFVLLMPSFWKK